MARFSSNENFPLRCVQELRQIGHDVLTSLEAGKANLAVPDEEVLTFAATEGRAVLTLNRKHFVRLHRHHVEHSGIVVCTYGANQARLATRINQAVAPEVSLAGKLDSRDPAGVLTSAFRFASPLG